jgi:hypothetical protein
LGSDFFTGLAQVQPAVNDLTHQNGRVHFGHKIWVMGSTYQQHPATYSKRIPTEQHELTFQL